MGCRRRLVVERGDEAGQAIDWAELVGLRVPSAFLRVWSGRSPVALHLRDARGLEVGRYGPAGDAVCAGDCGVQAAVEAAGVFGCRCVPGLLHIAVPIVLDEDRAAGVAVSGSFASSQDGCPDSEAPEVEPSLVKLLVRQVELVAREMGLYWRSKRARLGRDALNRIIGRSPRIRSVQEAIPRLARTERTVLIEGETGTGKDLVAQAVHELSRRSGGPFVVVQCAAVPDGLLESVLFGHEAGAFTGAVARGRGLFEAAAGGTLFLDEVPSMSPALQGKLLRVLESNSFLTVGGAESIRADVRVVAAANEDLEQLVREGGFRADLYYRLHVLRVSLPPLRERVEDIATLAEHFAARTTTEEATSERKLAPEALRALERYRWPGNVRELAHAVERAVIETEDNPIPLSAFAPAIRAAGAEGAANERRTFRECRSEAMEAWERQFLARELRLAGGNQSALARALDMSRSRLGEKLRRYGLVGR